VLRRSFSSPIRIPFHSICSNLDASARNIYVFLIKGESPEVRAIAGMKSFSFFSVLVALRCPAPKSSVEEAF
jgi:hypothetical protein